MTNLKSAMLDNVQKETLRQSIFMYVSDLQKKFYKEKTVTEEEYESGMKTVSEIIEVLHLKNCY